MPRSAVKTYNRVSNRKARKIQKRTGKPLTANQSANVERRSTRQMNRKMAHSRGEKTGKGTEYYKGSKKWAKEKGKGKYGSGPSKKPAAQSKPAAPSRPQRQGGGARTESAPGGQQFRQAQPQPQPQIQPQQPAPYQASAQGPVAQAPGQEQAMQQYLSARPPSAGPYGGALAGQVGPEQIAQMPQLNPFGQMGGKSPGMGQPGMMPPPGIFQGGMR